MDSGRATCRPIGAMAPTKVWKKFLIYMLIEKDFEVIG